MTGWNKSKQTKNKSNEAHEFIYSSDDKNIMLYDCQNGQSRPITTKLNTVCIVTLKKKH